MVFLVILVVEVLIVMIVNYWIV